MIGFRRHSLSRVVALMVMSGFLCVYPAAGEMKTDREQAGLHGPVRSIHTEQSVFSQRFLNWVEGSRVPVSTVRFDSDGNKTEEIQYYADRSINTRITYTYDENGNKVEQSEYGHDGTLQSKWMRRYDNGGFLAESVQYNPDGSLAVRTIFAHDDDGRMTAAAQYDGDGGLLSNRVYGYDYAGRMTEWAEYQADGSLIQRMEYIPDQNGGVAGYAWYDSDGVLKRKISASPETGVEVPTAIRHLSTISGKKSSLLPRIEEATTAVSADALKPPPPETPSAGGDEESRSTTAEEEMSVAEWVEEKPEKAKYRCEYDSHGNWITRIRSNWTQLDKYGNHAFTPSKAEYRTITYY